MSCLHYRIPASFRNLGMKANAYLTVNMIRGEKIWLVEMVVARRPAPWPALGTSHEMEVGGRVLERANGTDLE